MRSSRHNIDVTIALLAVVVAVVLTSVAQSISGRPIAFSWGDGALLEIYTNYATRGVWRLGPHSQFMWNHPGPLLFYLLVPFYKLAQSHAFGLNAGALAINVGSVLACAWAVVRWAPPLTACAILLTVGVYILRVDSVLLVSYWNPHVVVLALPAFIVLCAAVGAGYPSALPIAVGAASFLAQTHVSLVPVVTALVSASLVGLLSASRGGSDRVPPIVIRRWLGASVGVFVVLWCLPLIEEATRRPGNLTKLLRFFTQPYDLQPWSAAAVAWGDAVSTLFARRIDVPTGARLELTNAAGWVGLAAVQLVLLVMAGWNAKRRGDPFLSSINWIGAAASLVALWSITRIRAFVGDYMVFWVSIVGALNWGILAASAVTSLEPRIRPWRGLHRAIAPALVVVVVGGVTALGVWRLQRLIQIPQNGPPKAVAVLIGDVEPRLHNLPGSSWPLVCISQAVWSEAAGVVAGLYKRGVPLSIEHNWVSFFGDPLAPTGQENFLLHIADTARHEQLARRGDELVTSYGGVYVHLTSGFDGIDGSRCAP